IGTYGGPSQPGTAYVLLHHYLGRALGARGTWGYVRGGIGNITGALAAFLRARGGEIRVSSPVRRVHLGERSGPARRRGGAGERRDSGGAVDPLQRRSAPDISGPFAARYAAGGADGGLERSGREGWGFLQDQSGGLRTAPVLLPACRR